jgi:hypothetical protein
VHPYPEPHVAHVTPALPHALEEVPPAQVDPLRHPVQQLPETHAPPVHEVPSVRFDQLVDDDEGVQTWQVLLELTVPEA